MKTPSLLTLSATLALSALPAHATLIAADSFGTNPDGTGGYYSNGSSLSDAINRAVLEGNSGFSSSRLWTTNTSLVMPYYTSYLTHSGLTSNGNATAPSTSVVGSINPLIHTGDNDRNAYRVIDSTLATTDTTYYLSALVNYTSFSSTSDAFSIGMGGVTTMSTFDVDTGFHLGLLNTASGVELTAWAGGSSYSLGAATAGTTYQVILGLTTSAAGTETLNAWVAADGATGLTQALTNQSIAASAYVTGADISALNLNLSKAALAPVATIDEMRFGTTLADVTAIPEPTTALLGGLSLLGLLRRRRA